MLVRRYNPSKELQEFRKGFEHFDSFLDNFIDNGRNILNSDFNPSVNTREGESAYHVEVDLPGVKKEDINVDVKDNMVTISGERKTKEKDFNYE